jgi:uncharacterized protein
MKRTFAPKGWLKNPHFQSVLASSGLRGLQARRRFPGLVNAEREITLECGSGVRLTGLIARQAGALSRGLIVLIHGWEGSVQSSYLVSTGGRLYEAGFDVFRLNLRDHGNTHGLNEELFHSCRLDEVLGAVQAVLRQEAPKRAVIGGFSLGGNFALRVARAIPHAFEFAFAICPPLVPGKSLEAIELAPWFYQSYFLRKWTQSLALKEKLFPTRYSFESWRGFTIRQVTAALVAQFTDFPSMESYLEYWHGSAKKPSDADARCGRQRRSGDSCAGFL